MVMSFVSLSRRVDCVCVLVAALALFVAAFGATARADAGVMPPDSGIQWCTVGGGANRPANAQELAGSPYAGGLTFPFEPVAQDFRISKAEITNTQWVEFYRAYVQFNPAPPAAISGGDIRVLNGVVRIVPGREQWPATMGWEFAARYANWLHNDKAMTAQAFEQGVYDTSTFYRDANGVNRHQHLLPRRERREPAPGRPRAGSEVLDPDVLRVGQGGVLGPDQGQRRGRLLALPQHQRHATGRGAAGDPGGADQCGTLR